MLSKMNLGMAIAIIALTATVFVGCNNGGGGGQPPVVDCRLPQNFNNTTCINARPGNNRPYSPYGRGSLGVGTFSRTPPEWGVVVLNVTNPAMLISLCQQAIDRGVSGYQRSTYQQGDVFAPGYQNSGYQMGGLCMTPGTTVVTFHTQKSTLNNGQDGYIALWKFYFIPPGIPVNAQTPVAQLQAMGPATQVFQGTLVTGPNGGFQADAGGLIFSGVDNGTSMNVSILTPRGPIGNGAMTVSPF